MIFSIDVIKPKRINFIIWRFLAYWLWLEWYRFEISNDSSTGTKSFENWRLDFDMTPELVGFYKGIELIDEVLKNTVLNFNIKR